MKTVSKGEVAILICVILAGAWVLLLALTEPASSANLGESPVFLKWLDATLEQPKVMQYNASPADDD